MNPIRVLAVLTLAAVAGPAVLRAQQAGAAEPEVRAHVDAFVDALRGTSADAYEAMAQAHFIPALLARATPAERRAMFERIRGDFGPITVTSVRVQDGVASIAARGATGMAGRFGLTLEPVSPFRVTRLAVEVGDDDPADRQTVVIALKPDMTAADMTRTLDVALQPLVGRDAFAGVVLIARDGTPLLQRAYGLADRESSLAATAEMRFNLGSINKIFTKVAIGQLLAAGKLALTDTVGALLPDYPDTPARRATVDQLLNHRGGVADFFGPAFDAAPKDRFRANADYYRFVAAQPVRFEPGARQEYLQRLLHRARRDRRARLGHALRDLPGPARLHARRHEGHRRARGRCVVAAHRDRLHPSHRTGPAGWSAAPERVDARSGRQRGGRRLFDRRRLARLRHGLADGRAARSGPHRLDAERRDRRSRPRRRRPRRRRRRARHQRQPRVRRHLDDRRARQPRSAGGHRRRAGDPAGIDPVMPGA